MYAADLELARRCADGDEAAWERFIGEYRPLLYRAADRLDPAGGARDLADALYADLYGVTESDGVRRSLFKYFHGRSSLATWLRAVLAQRFVDRIREARRLIPLVDDEGSVAVERGVATTAPGALPDPDRPRYLQLAGEALELAIGKLAARDRLRLRCYYAQELTLAETGRVMAEHEATVSRQLAKTRRWLRSEVERVLRDSGMVEAQIAECLRFAAEDPGTLDLSEMLSDRKRSLPDRSLG